MSGTSFNKLILLVAFIASSVEVAIAVETFIGCVSSSYTPSTVQTISGETSAANCAAACGDDNIGYSFYQASTSTCACSWSQAPFSDYTEASDENFDCDSTDWSQYLALTTNTLQSCNTDYTQNEDGWYTNTESTFEDCFSYAPCASYGGINAALYQPSTKTCLCGDTTSWTFTDSEACSTTSYWYFTHPTQAAGVGPSQYHRRLLKERLVRDQSRMTSQAYCPSPATACMVQSLQESYECIDTAYELESCGGCVLGAFNDASAPKGIDCTTLSGVISGAQTCSDGKCIAYACQSGWTLSTNGTCII